MNPLKLTFATLLVAALLVAVPYSLRHVASTHPAPGPERAAIRGSNLADLPVDMPQSLLNVSRSRDLSQFGEAHSDAVDISADLPPPAPAPVPEVKLPIRKLPAPPSAVSPLAAPPAVETPKPEIPYRAEVAKAQELLNKLGFKPGVVDGKFGQRTEAAMIAFQKENSLKTDGQVTADAITQMEKMVASLGSKESKETSKKEETAIASAADDGKSAWDSVEKIKEPSAKERKQIARPARRSDNGPDDKESARTNDGHELEIAGKQPGRDGNVIAASVDGQPGKASVLEVSKPATETVETADAGSQPAVSESAKIAGSEIVMKVNADAGAPVTSALATPLAVSESMLADADAGKSSAAVDADLPGEKSAGKSLQEPGPSKPEPFAPTPMAVVDVPKAKISVPSGLASESEKTRTIVKVSLPAASEKDSVASAKKGNRSPEKLKLLEQQLAEAQAQVALVNSDSRYELGKYAPEARQAVTGLLDKVQRDLKSSTADPVSLDKDLTKLHKQVEEAKQQALSKKAAQKVDEVEDAYKELKSRYGEQLKKAPLKETFTKVEAGFKAMKADHAKGNYDPIIERCDGFKLAIEMLMNDAAGKYLQAKLDSKTVRGKLSKSALKEITSLKEKKKYIEAVSVLDSALKTKSKSSSKSKSRSKSKTG